MNQGVYTRESSGSKESYRVPRYNREKEDISVKKNSISGIPDFYYLNYLSSIQKCLFKILKRKQYSLHVKRFPQAHVFEHLNPQVVVLFCEVMELFQQRATSGRHRVIRGRLEVYSALVVAQVAAAEPPDTELVIPQVLVTRPFPAAMISTPSNCEMK